MPDSLFIFFKSSPCWLWNSSRAEPWNGDQNPRQHRTTSMDMTQWWAQRAVQHTMLLSCLLSLIYHSPSQNHTATESLESPGPRPSYSRATWRGCSEPYPAIFRDGDDMPLRMRRCVNTWKQAGHSISEGTYNYTYFQYQILNNKKGAYSLPSTFTLWKTPETAFQWWWQKQQSLISLKMEIASFLWKFCDAVVCAIRESLLEAKHFGKYCSNCLGPFC